MGYGAARPSFVESVPFVVEISRKVDRRPPRHRVLPLQFSLRSFLARSTHTALFSDFTRNSNPVAGKIVLPRKSAIR